MQRARPARIAVSLAILLAMALPGVTVAAKPTPSAALSDITATSRGRALAAESAVRFTTLYGVPTTAAELKVLRYSDGSIIVVPEILTSALTGQLSADGSTASVEVGGTLSSTTQAANTRTVQTQAATATWTQKEFGCLSSLYVDSARLDSCYYIYQLINDGSTTKNFWALRQKGTAFEYGAGLHSAWVSGERTPNTTAQGWVDWGPEQGHDGSCSTVNVGVSYIASLNYSITGCEKWIIDKSCNTCSPWMKATWDCNCFWGLDAKTGTVSRAIAYQMLVTTSQSATPRFRVGIGMSA
jgi:hypothetical protein